MAPAVDNPYMEAHALRRQRAPTSGAGSRRLLAAFPTSGSSRKCGTAARQLRSSLRPPSRRRPLLLPAHAPLTARRGGRSEQTFASAHRDIAGSDKAINSSRGSTRSRETVASQCSPLGVISRATSSRASRRPVSARRFRSEPTSETWSAIYRSYHTINAPHSFSPSSATSPTQNRRGHRLKTAKVKAASSNTLRTARASRSPPKRRARRSGNSSRCCAAPRSAADRYAAT